MEEKVYPLINTTLQASDCSGVFFILDATCNTEVPSADHSRMGIYLRYSNLSEVNSPGKHTVYFRGNSQIARNEEVEMHNCWNMEFDTAQLPEYDTMMNLPVSQQLADCCRWTGRLSLTDTWENVMLLCVPVLDGNGNSCGICGVEVSDLYFKLSYPSIDGTYGSMMTIMTSIEGSTLNLNNAMLGATNDVGLKPEGALTVKKDRFYNEYLSEKADYIGLTGNLTGKCVDGSQLSVVTLLSKKNYQSIVSAERRVWILGFLVFFLIVLLLSWVLTKYFVAPISRVLTDIREDVPIEGYHSGISELDELVEFIQYKEKENNQRELPPNVEELFQDFARKVSGLTPMERTVLQYYIDGCSIEEVAAKSFISVNTVKKHNTNINRKLEVSNREELMLYIDLFRRSGRLEDISSQ